MRFSLVLASTGDQLMCRMMHGALYGAIAPIRGEGAAHCREQCEVRHLRRTVVASARKVEVRDCFTSFLSPFVYI